MQSGNATMRQYQPKNDAPHPGPEQATSLYPSSACTWIHSWPELSTSSSPPDHYSIWASSQTVAHEKPQKPTSTAKPSTTGVSTNSPATCSNAEPKTAQQ